MIDILNVTSSGFFLPESPLIPMLSYLDLVLDVECFVINVSCLYLLLRPRNIPNVRSFLISLSFYIFFVTHFKSTKLHFSKNDVLDKSNLGFHCAKC